MAGESGILKKGFLRIKHFSKSAKLKGITSLRKFSAFAFVELMKRSPMFPLLPENPADDEVELFGGLS